jgi:hypothetical protein
MLYHEFRHPPYQFCDGGNATEESSEKKGEATVTVELPRVINVGYTDPDGIKSTEELDVGKLSVEQITAGIQKGHLVDKRQVIGDFNKRVENRARELAAERGTSVEKEVERILAVNKDEEEPVVDIEAVKNGDITSVVKALDFEKNKRIRLETALAEKDKQEELVVTRTEEFNKNIGIAKEKYGLDEKAIDLLVAKIKKLKIEPEAVDDLASMLSNLSTSGVDLSKLSKEDREKLEKQMKDELETPPPPPGGGGGGKAKPAEKEEDDDIPTDLAGMMEKAERIVAGGKEK